MQYSSRRVVITGIGLVTPLGCSLESTWHGLCGHQPAQQCSSVYTIQQGSRDRLASVVKQVPEDESLEKFSGLLGRHIPSQIRFALEGSRAALDDASLPTRFTDAEAPMIGTSVGVGMAHVPDLTDAARHLAAGKPRRVSPFLVPRVLVNTSAGLVAQMHNLQGPNTAPSTACAAGAHAVIDGFHAIKRGEARVMVVGGSESAIEDVGITGFLRANALSRNFLENPEMASRPFDSKRDGFVMGEGAGVLILEDFEHARQRGLKSVYAEVRGAGMSGDAYHVTSPSPGGYGAIRAMKAALDSGSVACGDVEYINAHATGTPAGDAVERKAIAKLFNDSGRAGRRTVVSSIKGNTGHLLGASGAVEAAVTALVVSTGRIPPTVNLESLDKDKECTDLGWGDIDRYVPNNARDMQVDVALTNSFGFGGTNACILLTAPPEGFGRRTLNSYTQE